MYKLNRRRENMLLSINFGNHTNLSINYFINKKCGNWSRVERTQNGMWCPVCANSYLLSLLQVESETVLQ